MLVERGQYSSIIDVCCTLGHRLFPYHIHQQLDIEDTLVVLFPDLGTRRKLAINNGKTFGMVVSE